MSIGIKFCILFKDLLSNYLFYTYDFKLKNPITKGYCNRFVN